MDLSANTVRAGEGAESAPPEIAGYEMIRCIGKGGMGSVYAARQLSLGRLVAIKVLTVEHSSGIEDHIGQFRREAELMARVSHPSILSIYDFGVVDGKPFLVMEYAGGGDLRHKLVEGQPMPIEQVRILMARVADALVFLHRHGVLHRDLKPENILLDDAGNPRVADFGIAMLHAGWATSELTERVLGTVGYVAPEQQYLWKVDERSDQYSLAAIAYELLTGRKALGLFKPPSEHNKRLGSDIDAVILRALREEPKERFNSVRDFADALDRALTGPTRRVYFPRTALAVGGTLVLLLALGALIRLWYSPVPTDNKPPVVKPHPEVKTPPLDTAPSAEDPYHELTRHRAHLLWKAASQRTGQVSKDVQDQFWFRAESEVHKEVEKRAYSIWENHGAPTGELGESLRETFWKQAIKELLEIERTKRQLKEKEEKQAEAAAGSVTEF